LAVSLGDGADTMTINGLAPGKVAPMSIDLGIGTDTLTINGTGGDDAIELMTGGFRSSPTEALRTFNSTVENIVVFGGSGDDTLPASGTLPKTTLNGSFDNDSLIVTNAGAGNQITLLGSDGSDALFVDAAS